MLPALRFLFHLPRDRPPQQLNDGDDGQYQAGNGRKARKFAQVAVDAHDHEGCVQREPAEQQDQRQGSKERDFLGVGSGIKGSLWC